MNRFTKRVLAFTMSMVLLIGAFPLWSSAAIAAGDINGDSLWNITDALMLYKHAAGQYPLSGDALAAADYTLDGKTDMVDAVTLYSYVNGKLGTHPGQNVIRLGVTDESVYMKNISVKNTCTGRTFTGKTKADLQMAVAEIVRYEIGMSYFGKNSDEAWKAFAVAAYTMLARHCYNGKTYNIYMTKDIDLNDSTDRRIYDACGKVLGIKVAYNDPSRSPLNQLVEMFYSASSAGMTCTTLNAWSFHDLEYLKQIPSPYDNDDWIRECSGGTDSLTHTFTITMTELLNCVARWKGVSKVYYEQKSGEYMLYPRQTDGPYWAYSNLYYYNSSGTLKYVSGVDIYTAINMYGAPHCHSHALTVIRQSGDTLTIQTKGNGHGVGISQYGAAGFANQAGWTYDQILAYYYSITDTSAWGLVGPKW